MSVKQFHRDFNDVGLGVNELQLSSFVLPGDEDFYEGMLIDFAIEPLKQLIDEKLLTSGTYCITATTLDNETCHFNAYVRYNNSVVCQYTGVPKMGKKLGSFSHTMFQKKYKYDIYLPAQFEVVQ
jgi:hypothetical protein